MRLRKRETATRDYSRSAICRALTEILVHFRVYRIYTRVGCASQADREFLSFAVDRAERTLCSVPTLALVAVLGHWLSGAAHQTGARSIASCRADPIPAIERTALRKSSGGHGFLPVRPLTFAKRRRFRSAPFRLSIANFHRKMQCRESQIPHAMLATATHDHKRGEDVRARLAVLSEIPGHWARPLERWLDLSASYRRQVARHAKRGRCRHSVPDDRWSLAGWIDENRSTGA